MHRLTHLLLVSALAGCAAHHGASEAERDAGGADATIAVVDGGPFAADTAIARDAGSDAGPRNACGRRDVAQTLCPFVICDSPPRWHWQEGYCIPIECGTCIGPDCDEGYLSEEECLAAFAECEAGLCATTGGQWMWWAPHCGHLVCGRANEEIACFAPFPGCDCGAGRSFDPGVGCVEDPECPTETATAEELCVETGGLWSSTCCPSVCGIECGFDCVADACTCGRTEIFDPMRGCVEDVSCYAPGPGYRCDAPARGCRPGLVCCPPCPEGACPFPPTCQRPACGEEGVCG